MQPNLIHAIQPIHATQPNSRNANHLTLSLFVMPFDTVPHLLLWISMTFHNWNQIMQHNMIHETQHDSPWVTQLSLTHETQPDSCKSTWLTQLNLIYKTWPNSCNPTLFTQLNLLTQLNQFTQLNTIHATRTTSHLAFLLGPLTQSHISQL